MPSRIASAAHKGPPVVHVYGTSAQDAEIALAATARAAPHAVVRLHIEAAAGRSATARPALMALLAEAEVGDILCGAATAFATAPPRARSRLTAVVKARDIGLALIDDPESMAQIAAGVVAGRSQPALARATAVRPLAPPIAAGGPPAPVAATAALEAQVLRALNSGQSWRRVQSQFGVSRAVIAQCAQRLAAVETAQSQAAFARSRTRGFVRDDGADDGFDSPP